jgi:endoglucanase Acf2
MAIHTSIDEHLEEKSSSLFLHGKPFKDEPSGSLEFDESHEGPEINLNYSIETGLEEHLNLQQNKKKNKLSSACSKIIDPRRRKVYFIVASVVLLGFILIVTISATVSNKKKQSKSSSISAASSIQDARNDVNSRGEGGGAGNGYFPTQNIGVFPINDEPIPPFSVLDPVQDLERYGYDRPTSSSPNARLDPLRDNKKGGALPTNSWYQNMLRLDVDQDPTKNHRVYTVPYILDAAGDFPGLRAHSTRLDATPSQVILQIDEPYALTLGAMTDTIKGDTNNDLLLDKGYSVHEATELGLTLHWGSYMKSTLARGSPYVTMIYNMADPSATSLGVLPTMHWELDTSELPVVDGTRTVDCQSEPVFTVELEIELAFHNSGQRWLVFFSRPVQLQCNNEQGSPTILQVLKDDDDYENPLLVVRGALIVSSFSTDDDDEVFSENYANKIRDHATVYPGQSTSVTHSFDEESDQARISFNWDPQSMNIRNINGVDEMISRSSVDGSGSDAGDEMIMFALPHHQEILSGDTNNVMPNFCTISLLGPVCLTTGNVWNMYEDLPTVGLQAPRHPDPKYVPVLAESLLEDIRYQIPDNFQRGAADTYFSGKTIARLARILLITEELKDVCKDISNNREYEEACDGLELPSNNEIDDALDQLRETVTVWVKTNAQSPFVYDNAWGGLISCGCMYDDGQCTNVFPDCPAFTDQGLNFGNAFYNDHHFHYGYHIYAAAVLAHFDAAWAIDHYEDVLLLVRDYANPSAEDTAFPTFRNKDWYRGHSWASGLTEPMFNNIMNQESTSEAIAAYESVALFGKIMTSIFQDAGDTEKASVAKMIHNVGLTLTATEIRSTQKYWQVRQNVDESEKRFPALYTASVVGILWETYVQFTTWFGNAPYLIYGIQLLPLTPISEARDNMQWAEEIYKPLAESCNAACISEGWSVQINAILATIGRVQEAVEATVNLPSSVFDHAGGNGHSKSNSLWYIATRPYRNSPSTSNGEEFETAFEEDPFIEVLDNESDYDNDDGVDEEEEEEEEESGSNDNNIFDEGATEDVVGLTCSNPAKCTGQILNIMAQGHSCGDRILYLMDLLSKTEVDACRQIAVDEYPEECGFCRPDV